MGFDQGLGRQLWYIAKGDLDKLLVKTGDAGIIDYNKQNVYNKEYRTPDFSEVNIEGQHLHDTSGAMFHQVVSRGSMVSHIHLSINKFNSIENGFNCRFNKK